MELEVNNLFHLFLNFQCANYYPVPGRAIKRPANLERLMKKWGVLIIDQTVVLHSILFKKLF
ncbi:hypothetical protein BST96_06950 [Oceanicoccus sagamiensis]|uniref:Uncharacterized protein n=1 Tax=Oceanicoccus sagamiensis TaxID=716816 RepID=A0A1X9NIQ9_9GAMM|nr:hypothetical protein BST96_06950 [Oceanicoccus sagamiensis]